MFIIGFIFYSCVQDLPLTSNEDSVDLSDEDIQEMDMQARQQAETAIQMSLLGDDDDHGENDGDEAF